MLRKFPELTYSGSAVNDFELLARLPGALAAALTETNGFIAFSGGLHVRGICASPDWHSLERIWSGSEAFHHTYTSLSSWDIPFGEDALGDQFFLRDNECFRLLAEVDDVDALGCDFDGFIAQALANPVEFIGLEPLIRFRREGGSLKPGELLNAYPPFSTKEAARGVRLAAVPAQEQHYFMAQLVTQLRDKPKDTRFRIEFK